MTNNINFWNEYWKKETRRQEEFMFADLLDKYLEWDMIGTYMEIGGAPGSIMSYMVKHHGLDVFTVDFCNKKIIDDFMENAHVKKYKIYDEDFETFDVEKHKNRYDCVASWGFIEHFNIKLTSQFIKKHKEMVSKNGYLIIELPNIRKFNWLIYKIFNKELLSIHNIKTMDLNYLRQEIIDDEFELLYGNYYLTSFFEYNSSNAFFKNHSIIKYIFMFFKVIGKMLHLSNIPNRVFSPYIVFIARRK